MTVEEKKVDDTGMEVTKIKQEFKGNIRATDGGSFLQGKEKQGKKNKSGRR